MIMAFSFVNCRSRCGRSVLLKKEISIFQIDITNQMYVTHSTKNVIIRILKCKYLIRKSKLNLSILFKKKRRKLTPHPVNVMLLFCQSFRSLLISVCKRENN